MVEAFPKHVRCTGLAISYNLAHSIFGGTVPLVATTLVRYTHYNLAPSFYLIAASIISLIMAIKLPAQPRAD
jgi:MHS family proline/betaine transporter-like MFS transporter